MSEEFWRPLTLRFTQTWNHPLGSEKIPERLPILFWGVRKKFRTNQDKTSLRLVFLTGDLDQKILKVQKQFDLMLCNHHHIKATTTLTAKTCPSGFSLIQCPRQGEFSNPALSYQLLQPNMMCWEAEVLISSTLCWSQLLILCHHMLSHGAVCLDRENDVTPAVTTDIALSFPFLLCTINSPSMLGRV